MVIFRNDDLNPSTNMLKVGGIYNVIKSQFATAQIISCITLFGQKNTIGAVYSDVPFKNKFTNWFYDVDSFFNDSLDILRKSSVIASHGLFHINHATVSKEVQEMSILSSCAYLKTKIFCPPFNAYNEDTVDIARRNNIEILNESKKWKSLEFNDFDYNHIHWYFHSWRYTPKTLKDKLCNGS